METQPTSTSASGLKSQITKGMESTEKEKNLPNEDSYMQRRMLFKDIWDTVMTIDEKDEILTKPKVVKTLRLDEADKLAMGKSRKQRIKNLRHVCKRILEYCDKQDASDKLYEQFLPGKLKMDSKKLKKKTPNKVIKKKVKNVTSLFNPHRNVTVMKSTVSERRKGKRRTSKVASPIISRKKNITINVTKKAKSKSPENISPTIPANAAVVMKRGLTRKKPVKKKLCNMKNISPESTLQALSNMLNSKTAALVRRNIAKVNSARTPKRPQTLTKQLSAAVEINRTN